jgi:hypothetical protein
VRVDVLDRHRRLDTVERNSQPCPGQGQRCRLSCRRIT